MHDLSKSWVAGLMITALLLISVGCGDSNNQSPAANNTTPTSPTPNTPTSNAGGQYLATMFLVSDGSSAAPRGTVVVDAQADNGSGTLQISGGQPTTSYDLQFCVAPSTCKPVTTYTTDANGSASINFQIPAGTSGTPGHYVGSFFVSQSGNAIYNSGASAQASGVSFSAPLLPGLPENPPGGGSVSVSGQTLHVALAGVPPNLNYEVLLCSFTPARSQVQLVRHRYGQRGCARKWQQGLRSWSPNLCGIY